MRLSKEAFKEMVSGLIDAGVYCLRINTPAGLMFTELSYIDASGKLTRIDIIKSTSFEGRHGQYCRFNRWLKEVMAEKAVLPARVNRVAYQVMSATDILEQSKLVLSNLIESCNCHAASPSQSDRAIVLAGMMKRFATHEGAEGTLKWLSGILPLDGCYPISSFKDKASAAIGEIDLVGKYTDIKRVREDKLAEARKLALELSRIIETLVDTYSDVSNPGSQHPKSTLQGLVERTNTLNKGIKQVRL